ncbi:hypothetical protein DCAR_0934970 [Daucus carota subsp. sativus]|uniref:Leucine-rich repeat-containing N-terminal plant-type domain-containing protein n=1 Tax=Daucus carota subsp. sativus TaxID=79200 RepID=A0A175YFV5_DAUCS|nr:hypothetical protein DCAR_0934970 [Daucus carota subsp. sativus]
MAEPLSMIELLVRLSFIFLLVPCLSCPAYHKQSLLHFKSSLLTSYETSNSTSFGLESWDSISDCCKWTRVVCSSHARHITALHLGDLHMHDEFRPVDIRILDPIYGIRSLRFLNISYTGIEGEISGEGLANLTKLIYLDMSYETSNSTSFGLESWDSIFDCCKWSRVVCSSHSRDITALHLGDLHMHDESRPVDIRILDPIYGIRSLRFLNISHTGIQGEISGEGLANLTKLTYLDMSQNSLNGSIPAQLFQLRFLQSLDLSDNSLKDGLSREIGKLGNLRSLKLDRNSIDGNIPVRIGNLTRLQQFSVSRNKLLGPIPDSILNLKGLEKLDFHWINSTINTELEQIGNPSAGR